MAAKTASHDHALRLESWLVFAVCLSALLPSVLSGFVGGLIGFRFSGLNRGKQPVSPPPQTSVLVKGTRLTIAIIAAIGLASPLGLLSKARVVDPIPIVPQAPVFLYEPPADIVSAKVGELQPAAVKTITGIQGSCPVAMSPDNTLIAFGASGSAGSVVGVYDLHRFVQISSIKVPDFPNGSLAWSPDQKSIACTIGSGGSRRIWILGIAGQTATELPRPPGRDVPGGELCWWQKDELAFFPDDEASLAFDLDTLLFHPFVESPHYTKLESNLQQRWKDGPVYDWPHQNNWKLGLKTLITSAVPPPRRNPESPWELSGLTICAYEHPQLPLAFGIHAISANEGDRIFCSSDGSKIIRLRGDEVLVIYMKKVSRPDVVLEVEMPRPFEQLENDGLISRGESKELCLFICEPMINPLNREVVGANYKNVHAVARLHEWQGRKAKFIVSTFDGRIRPDDVAVTLHTWNEGKMSEWKAPGIQNWWAHFRFLSSSPPETLPELEDPQHLSLAQEPTSMVVTKYVAKPRVTATPTILEPMLARPTLPILGSPILGSPILGSPILGSPIPSLPLPISPSAPPVTILSDNDVKHFLSEHHAKASRGDVAGMIADYDATVDFLNKGRIPVTAIEAEETAQRQKWPKGQEQVVDTINVSESAGVWSATYTITFYNENGAGEWHKGRADLMLNLRTEGTRLYITSQKAKVYDVTDSKASAPKPPPVAPAKGQASKAGAITVPRPCFVMVTRPRDLPQIEFTDQISFADGLMWHRTYRELSADGKVLRTCRAIYEATNGGQVDRNTATFRIGVQGWDRDFGDGLLTGVCAKNARSLVGRTFEFQFVPGGMVENQTGMVFQRVE
ncbi:MAG: WD40 repeat domain-containing protein [Verrucomicrobiota bacterium]